MLGLLEIDGKARKVTAERRKLAQYDLMWVKIPKIKGRYIKKTEKLLRGRRVIVWDDCDLLEIRKFGINTVPPGKIYKYFTDKIFIKAIEKAKISKNARVVLHIGRICDREKVQIDKIIKNSRHISVKGGNMEEVSCWLMENYGISQMNNINRPDIEIFMYDEGFNLYLMRNGCRCKVTDVDFRTKKEYGIGQGHIKSAYVALINGGALSEKDVDVFDITFKCEKLT